mmetsp:Transcript_44873/g.97636  ORF Transcript_44873/g.97636 Transcript_44873/m.97636 type:complete len:206 (+) Transcript_44873:165-782(+)
MAELACSPPTEGRAKKDLVIPTVAHSFLDLPFFDGVATLSNHSFPSTCDAVGRCVTSLVSIAARRSLKSDSCEGIMSKGGFRVRVALKMSSIVRQPSTKMPPGVVVVLGPVGGLLSRSTWMKVTPKQKTSPLGNHLRCLMVSGGMYPGVPPGMPLDAVTMARQTPKSMTTTSGLRKSLPLIIMFGSLMSQCIMDCSCINSKASAH